jgi:hypothetical protein
MAPLPRLAAAFALLLSCARPSAFAQDDSRADIVARMQAQKAAAAAPASAAPATAPAGPAPVLRPRSDVARYLFETGDKREFYRGGYYTAPDDDAKKLAADAALAIRAYARLDGRAVSFADDQKFASLDFFMRTGEATFNPNRDQTAALNSDLRGMFAGGPVLQVDLIYEALKATHGNLTLAMGSLAELFCADRTEYVPQVADMGDAGGKNYYRFAGFFIGLHGWTARTLGAAGSYANMAGNPVVYAGYEVYDSWRSYFTGGGLKPIDTLHTLGPQGNGDLVDKGGELHKGFDAAESLRPSGN